MKDRFYPGEIITGRVFADTKERFEARCLQLSIVGMEHHQYETQDDDGNTQTVNVDEQCYELDFILADLIDGLEAPIGRYEYPFSIQVPNDLTPSWMHCDSQAFMLAYYLRAQFVPV